MNKAPCRMMTSRCAFPAIFIFGYFVAGAALAQSPPAAPLAPAEPAETRQGDTLSQRNRELELLRRQQQEAVAVEVKLKQELEAIGDDRRKLMQALLDAAARQRSAEERSAEIEVRLKSLDEHERAMRESLASRRGIIAEVLAALQRIGRDPPAAVMVKPEDALGAVRSAILLGAVLPHLREQADALAADLAALARLRKDIAEEQERLQRSLAALAQERMRAERLMEERRRRQAETEETLAAARQRALDLARQVDNLNDLIGKLEQSLDAVRRAAGAEGKRAGERRSALAALKDPGRLAPAIAFPAARGHLLLPVNGTRIREFGAADAAGGTEKGLSIATRAGSQVISPCDGWVVYAAPFRHYGQVLILDAGGGYHVVLAGMEQIYVGVGQFVLTGEPVAIMGNGSPRPSGGAAVSQPVLYVEFRKDGIPIDPSPWWAKSEKKVRG